MNNTETKPQLNPEIAVEAELAQAELDAIAAGAAVHYKSGRAILPCF